MSSPCIYNDFPYVGVHSAWGDAWHPCDWGGQLIKLELTYVCDPPGGHSCDIHPLWGLMNGGIQCDVRGAPVGVDGVVYVSSGRGLFGFDEDDGDMVYGEDSSKGVQLTPGSGHDEIWSSLTASDRSELASPEVLFFVGDGGSGEAGGDSLFALDEDLVKQWSYYIGCASWSSAAISNGKVIMTDNCGTVYCFVTSENGGGGRLIAPNGQVTEFGPDPQGEDFGTRTSDAPEWQENRATLTVQPAVTSGETKLSFRVAPGETYRLSILDASGRLMRTFTGYQNSSEIQQISWDGSSDRSTRSPTGIYYCKLESATVSRNATVTLVR